MFDSIVQLLPICVVLCRPGLTVLEAQLHDTLDVFGFVKADDLIFMQVSDDFQIIPGYVSTSLNSTSTLDRIPFRVMCYRILCSSHDVITTAVGTAEAAFRLTHNTHRLLLTTKDASRSPASA